MIRRIHFIILFLPLIQLSCLKDEDVGQMQIYNGPFMELDNIETLYSDSAVLRVKLRAPKQIELQNGDRQFPKGVHIEFYDESGKKSSDLTSNNAIFNKEKNLYTVKGNVIIQNIAEKKRLNTEELEWNPDTKKINTNKFVRIETPEQTLWGEGLDATEDFSSYRIYKPVTKFNVEVEE